MGVFRIHYFSLLPLYLIKNSTLDVNVTSITRGRFNKWSCSFQAAMNELADEPNRFVGGLPDVGLVTRRERNILDSASSRVSGAVNHLSEYNI